VKGVRPNFAYLHLFVFFVGQGVFCLDSDGLGWTTLATSCCTFAARQVTLEPGYHASDDDHDPYDVPDAACRKQLPAE
jgi:hypothetical protein